MIYVVIRYSSNLPFEQTLLAFPALSESVGDADGKPGVEEYLREIGIESCPKT